MIITCPCGEKRFEIDAALIPDKGRTLKCGSCDKVWFFKMNLENKVLLRGFKSNVFPYMKNCICKSTEFRKIKVRLFMNHVGSIIL